MAIEIEKKYRIDESSRRRILSRLLAEGVASHGVEVEENILFAGGLLRERGAILRLRKTGTSATLTFKREVPTGGTFKHREEFESRVEDPEAIEAIIGALGLTRSLVYEKRRETFNYQRVEIVVDELPFGLFVELEGLEEDIDSIESFLGFEATSLENSSYPALAFAHGRAVEGRIESRFKYSDHSSSRI